MTSANSFLVSLSLLAVLASPSPGHAGGEECGTVAGTLSLEKAKIKYDGAKSGKFVVVSLEKPGQEPLVATPDPIVHMDQRGLVFIPHVIAVQIGQSVEFLNSDNDRHNVYFLHDETGETLDIGTWGAGVSVTHTFDKPGLYITLCTLHLEMAAYVVVYPHPYFVVTEFDENTGQASYSIGDVPAGEYEIKVWHKKLKQKGGPKTITVVPQETTVLDDVVTKKKYAG